MPLDPDVPGSSGPGDRFGSTLLGVDVGGGAQADLIVGVPGAGVVVIPASGVVDVIFGTASGLTGSSSLELHQGANGVLDFAEAADGLGASLAGGNFGNGHTRDLAIGAPGEDSAAGAVNAVFGSPTGPSSSNGVILREGTGGIGDSAEPGDRFGQSMG